MEEEQNHGVGGAEGDVQAMHLRQAVRVRIYPTLACSTTTTNTSVIVPVCVMIAVSRVRRDPECLAATSLQGSLQISQALHLFFSLLRVQPAWIPSAEQSIAHGVTKLNMATFSLSFSRTAEKKRMNGGMRISGIKYATFIYIYVYKVEENYVDIWKKCTYSLNEDESRNL
ncbi:hypothetical protein CBL_08554 [Carabus blaptoides fortunei]